MNGFLCYFSTHSSRCPVVAVSGGVYISVGTHLALSFRAKRRNLHLGKRRFLSCRCAQDRQSLALLGMTGEPNPTFPPKTIRYPVSRRVTGFPIWMEHTRILATWRPTPAKPPHQSSSVFPTRLGVGRVGANLRVRPMRCSPSGLRAEGRPAVPRIQET